jgi:hypothetical protein
MPRCGFSSRSGSTSRRRAIISSSAKRRCRGC